MLEGIGGIHFNTSHVSIKPGIALSIAVLLKISIHLMFLLITVSLPASPPARNISIHLMFLLIKDKSGVTIYTN